MTTTILSHTPSANGGFSATVDVAGQRYWVSVQRGASVRMAFAKRGQRGYRWYGIVRGDAKVQWFGKQPTKDLFNGHVAGKNITLVYLLEVAGVTRIRKSELTKLVKASKQQLARLASDVVFGNELGPTFPAWARKLAAAQQALPVAIAEHAGYSLALHDAGGPSVSPLPCAVGRADDVCRGDTGRGHHHEHRGQRDGRLAGGPMTMCTGTKQFKPTRDLKESA